jgi:hypothetical protein
MDAGAAFYMLLRAPRLFYAPQALREQRRKNRKCPRNPLPADAALSTRAANMRRHAGSLRRREEHAGTATHAAIIAVCQRQRHAMMR